MEKAKYQSELTFLKNEIQQKLPNLEVRKNEYDLLVNSHNAIK